MKKVGIVTLWDNNYGSALQCFSVKRIYRDLGYNAIVLNQAEHSFFGRLKQRLSFHFQRLILVIVNPKRFFEVLAQIKKTRMLSHNKIRFEEINSFVYEKVGILNCSYKESKRLAKAEEFAFFSSGSDQIWSYNLGVLQPFNYLRFAPFCKKVSLAASFGIDKKPPLPFLFKKYIKSYKILTVREQSGYDTVAQYDKRVKILGDPCFYLTKEQWETLIEKENDFKKEEPYVCAYFLNKPSDSTIKTINEYATANKKKIISIQNDFFISDKFVDCTTPFRFLSIIKNSFCVFTDSFHGVVFSIIFEKDFWVFKRGYANSSDQSTRLLTVLDTYDLKSRFIPYNCGCTLEGQIDYSKLRNITSTMKNRFEPFKKCIKDSFGK